MAPRLVRWLSRFTPRWRREDWLREWEGELAGRDRPQPLASVATGALAHIAWLWSHEWSLDMFQSDLRYAVRMLFRDRTITAAAVLTLALGIGAAVAMLAVVDAVLVRSFPYGEPDRIVAVWPRASVSPKAIDEGLLSGPAASLFDAAGAYSGWGFTLTGGDQAELVSGARVTPGLFPELGVQPLHGRLFADAEQRPGRDRVALVGERLWRRRLGGHASAIGRTIEIGGAPYEVIGVLPEHVEFPERRSELWLPITLDPAASDYNSNFAVVIARLAPGMSRRQAEERLRVYAGELQARNPRHYGGRLLEYAQLVPLRDYFVRDRRTPLLLLLASVMVLLLVACANVGGLLLTRGAARQGEMALRAALGADRLRLFRQLAVEGLLLSGLGCVAGLAFAWLLLRLIVPLAPEALPNLQHAAIDLRMAAAAVVMAMACALLFGAAPGLAATRRNLRGMLGGRGAARGQQAANLRRAFVFSQIVLAMLLTIPAALLAKSFVNLARVDPGFDPDAVLAMRVSAPAFAYRGEEPVRDLYARIGAAIETIPGVERAGMIQLLPLTGGNWNPGVAVEGRAADQQYPDAVNWRTVNPSYFPAMRIPLRQGRLLTAADDQRGMPVAVVNETFVRAVFAGKNPIGTRIRTAFEPRGTWVTVVGVVGDVRQHALADAPNAEMYRPFAQHPVSSMWMMIRAADPLAVAAPVRARLSAIDRNIAVADVEPMTAVVDRALGGTRLPLMLATGLAVVALTIGLIGIAGVLAFDVTERRVEIGVRLALGQPPASVRNGFLYRTALFGGAAVLVGVAAAVLASNALASLLYGVTPHDPMVIGGVAAAGFAAVLAAGYGPAARAARVDPIVTLRGHG